MRSFRSLVGLNTGGIPGLSGFSRRSLFPGLGSPNSGGGAALIGKLLGKALTAQSTANTWVEIGGGSTRSAGATGYGNVGSGSQSRYIPNDKSGGGGA